MSMWNTAVVALAQQQTDTTLTYVQKHQIRVKNPVPENIGCQYASEVRGMGSLFYCRCSNLFLLISLDSTAQRIGE